MVTSLYAGILGFLYIVMTLETIMARQKKRVSLGVGENQEIIHLVSAHSNFSSYTPFFLILFFLAERHGGHLLFLHTLGIVFFLGRLIHFLSMRDKEQNFKQRSLGMKLTIFSLLILSGLSFMNWARDLML